MLFVHGCVENLSKSIIFFSTGPTKWWKNRWGDFYQIIFVFCDLASCWSLRGVGGRLAKWLAQCFNCLRVREIKWRQLPSLFSFRGTNLCYASSVDTKLLYFPAPTVMRPWKPSTNWQGTVRDKYAIIFTPPSPHWNLGVGGGGGPFKM